MSLLKITLKGPLMSWGDADWSTDYRTTSLKPTKSAIIGLIGAVLGLKRGDEHFEQLKSLDYIVKTVKPGSLLNDYHTVTKPEKPLDFALYGYADPAKSYITHRYYLQDAEFEIYVAGNNDWDDNLILRIANAFKHPVFQPYLGRKSCPPAGPIEAKLLC